MGNDEYWATRSGGAGGFMPLVLSVREEELCSIMAVADDAAEDRCET